MAITDTLNEAKASVAEMMRRHKFKKANMERREAVELQSSLAKCRGKLEICRKDLERTIRNQSKNIQEGQRTGMDTLIQEQILWDAAIGYMLVKDAIFALKSISSYDSVAHAYEMLEAATSQMAGKKNRIPFPHIGGAKERNAYGYITSSAAVKDKGELLEGFFAQLKLSGDIEECLAAARIPVVQEAQQREAYTGGNISKELKGGTSGSSLDVNMERLAGLADADSAQIDYEAAMDAMRDIRPPEGV